MILYDTFKEDAWLRDFFMQSQSLVNINIWVSLQPLLKGAILIVVRGIIEL